MTSIRADSYLRQADNRRRQLHRQLLSLLPQLQIISHTMAKTAAATTENPTPTHARWTREEVDALVDYLHQHRSERTEGGGFKDSTFSGAVQHLQGFYSGGKSKDIKSIKYKWGTICDLILGKSIPDLGSQLKATLAVVTTWRNRSGTHYDDEHGANIVGESAAAVFEEFVSRRVSFVLLILYTIV